jgi:hypothetical protein
MSEFTLFSISIDVINVKPLKMGIVSKPVRVTKKLNKEHSGAWLNTLCPVLVSVEKAN